MSKERILVVDDERTILELGQRFLSSEGFDVETASQGMQAMKLLSKALMKSFSPIFECRG